MEKSVTAQKDKVPVVEKTLYGLGGPATYMGTFVGDKLSKQILNMQMGISPTLITLSIMVFRIYDGFLDPIMGWISDNTRSRWGRRKPFMFIGAILMALTVPLIYRFNPEWGTAYIIAWFIGIGLIFVTTQTLYNIPFQSLKMEMTPDYHERTSVNAYSSAIQKVIYFFLPWTWWLTQQPLFTDLLPDGQPDSLRGIQNVSLIFACVILVIGIIPSLICKERYYHKAKNNNKEPLLKSFKITFQSKPFRILIFIILFFQIEGLVEGLGGYLNVYHVWGGDRLNASRIGGIGGSLAAVVGLLSLPLWMKISKRFDKHRTLIVVFTIDFIAAIMVWFVYNPDYPYLVILMHFLNSILITGMWVVVPSLLADVIDHDELKTGERREGSFSSFFSWFHKLSGTLFYGLSGPIIDLIGFNAKLGGDQPPEVIGRMFLAMSILPACMGLLMILCMILYPLKQDTMLDIRKQLEERRGEIN